MSLNNFLFNQSAGELANNLANRLDHFNWSSVSIDRNANNSVPWQDTPAEIRQYLLIVRLVLLGIGTFDTLLLLAIYIKCHGILNNCLAVYVANISLAGLVALLDAGIWSLRQLGYTLQDLDRHLPGWVYKLTELPQFALPTISLFFLLLLVDRLLATLFAGCHRACYGSQWTAAVLLLLLWLASFFLTFVLVFPDLLVPHDPVYELLRFLVGYAGPFGLKLLLVLVLFAKRKTVPDSEQSQALTQRHRQSLYYALTIVTLHLVLSAPYYAIQANIYFRLVQIRLDEWIYWLTYILTEVPVVLNPILCLAIDPDFRDSLLLFCTCSSRSRRAELCDDHAESQPLAPIATSPMAEEKEHLDEAES